MLRMVRICSVLLLVAWGLAARSARAETNQVGLPVYPSVESTRFEGQLSTNQVPQEARVLFTKDTLDTVLEHYRKLIERRGLRVVEHRFGPASGYVGTFEVESGLMHMASAMQRPDGGTMIVLSSMNPLPLLEQSAKIPSDLPSLPEAVRVVSNQSKQGERLQRTLSFELPGKEPRQAKHELIQAALKLGWRLVPVDKEKSLSHPNLTLQRNNQMCMIYVRAIPKQENTRSSSSVTVVTFEIDTPSSEGAQP